MALFLWIVGIYLAIGIVVVVISFFKEPLLWYVWILTPLFVLIWPYCLWAVILFPKNSGRFI